MIKVHSATAATYIPLGSSWTSVYYQQGYFAVQVGLWVPSADYQTSLTSFDYLDDDIFGDNISYSFGSPVAHNWRSIYNYQTKADIYCSDFRSTIQRLDGDENRLTGNDEYFLKVGIGVGDIGFISDALLYGSYPSQPSNRCVLLPVGCMFLNLTETSWFRDQRTRGFCFVQYPNPPAVYENRHRERTFAPYHAEGGYIGDFGGSATIFCLGGDPPYLDSESSRVGFSSCEVNVSIKILATDGPRTWNAAWKEQLLLELAKSKPRLVARPRGNRRRTVLRQLPVPMLHAPNYEAVFDRFRRNPNWHQLASQAYQGLSFSDINGIAYVADAAEMGAAVKSFAKTLQGIPSRRVKAAAQAWLSVHYGFKLMLLDTVKLRDELAAASLRNSRKSKCQSSISYTRGRINYTARYQVFFNEFDQLLDLVDQMLVISDFSLTLENLWDMMPCSFVIDWFISVGDILSAIDGYATLTREHRVIAVGKSIKGETPLLNSMIGIGKEYTLHGARLTAYFRRYSEVLESPSFLPSVTVNPFKHLAEGAALVISRK